jgi:hypothetical protein
VTPISPSDDDIPRLIQEYNSMDPHLRSEFLDAMGMTREGWRSMVATHERRRQANRGRRSSTNASQTESSSTSGRDGNESSEREVLVVSVRLPRAARRLELLLEAGDSNGNARSERYGSAPPSRGFATTGPGRRRSGGGRRPGFRGRPDDPRVTIVIVLPEQ